MPVFADRMKTMEKSAAIIKKLFGSTNHSGIISFGVGAIAKETLPIDTIREITQEILQEGTRGFEALSYGPVKGIADLRQVVVEELLAPKGITASPENVMILNGGIEAMNLMCQVFINPGDVILVESPTFVHSVEIFDMFQASCVAVEMDEDGMDLDDLEAKIIAFRPKMIYAIPTFQNPTGRTYSRERRQKLAELGSRYDVVILEDDPYRDIRYSGEELPPIKHFDKTGHTVMANSFSKIFSPGSRLGYILADDVILDKLVDAKSATNSHTAMLPQIICAEFFKRGHYHTHHQRLCDIHRVRRDVMIRAIDAYFPAGTRRTFPDGGLFTWVELPGGINTTELLTEACNNPEVRVSFVAGEGFYIEGNGKGSHCMRLSFGGVKPEQIEQGIMRLGKLIHRKLEEKTIEETGQRKQAS
jgi:2-aminoadipate transaminase